MKHLKIALSIVLYNTSNNDIFNILNSLKLIKTPYKLFVIDNSKSNNLKEYFINVENHIYIHNPSNPGFGSSHNIALNESVNSDYNYHFIINPDVYFNTDVITNMIEYMEKNSDIGMMMPQVLNLNGTPQNLPKLLPSPLSILLRKLKTPKKYYQKFISKYELRFVDVDVIYNAPILSGCFTALRVNSLKEIGLYDDRFFMYFEDWDLSRRMHIKYKTIYYPKVSVYHGYESGANKSKRLFKIYVESAIKYFQKWGWFFDSDRTLLNKKALMQFKWK